MKKANLILLNLVIVVVLLIIACACNPTTVDEPNIQEKLQIVLDEVFANYPGKGLSAAVVFPDKTVWLGTANAEGATPISSSDLFWIGSITKMYTATVILQLMEEGKLTLGDRIKQFLPSYSNIDGDITIKQLLLHTSGVYEITSHPNFDEMMAEDYSKVWTPEEILIRLVLEPYFAPGEGWWYSNTNYTLLGMIIEKITDNMVSNEFRNRIYTPLSLTNTFLDCQETITGNIAPFWIDMDDDDVLDEFFAPFEVRASNTSVAYTCGGLFATAQDCAIFTHTLLRGDLLTQSTMNQMLDFNTDLPETWDDRGYGLGVSWIRLSIVNGAEAYGHGGNAFHISLTVYLKDYDIAITILQNFPNNWSLWTQSMLALCKVVMNFYDK